MRFATPSQSVQSHDRTVFHRAGILAPSLAMIASLSWILSSYSHPQNASPESHYSRGMELVRKGQLQEALNELKRAAELRPRDPRTHNMIGAVLTQLGRLEEADAAYLQALAVAPEFLPARKNRAVNAFTQRNFDLARKEFEALEPLTPNDFVPPLFLGLISLENLNFEDAVKHLSMANRLSPSNPKILIPLTRVNFILGKRDSALQLAGSAEASLQTDPERYELAVLLAQFEANTQAEGLFRGLKQRQPDSYDVNFNLALVEYRLGKYSHALQAINDFETRQKLSGEFQNLQGWILNKMGRWEHAQRSLEKAIELEPDNPDHYLDLSTALRNAGDIEKAMQVVLQGLQQCTERERLELQLGLLYQKMGKSGEAEKRFRAVLDRTPSNRSAYLALANLMASTERQAEALDLLKKGVEKVPSDALLRYTFGGLLLDAGQTEKAEVELKRALELNPLYANTHYLLGKLYLERGDLTASRTSFEKACGFNPGHVRAYYQLSLIARRQGNTQKAREYSEIVQKLNQQVHKKDEDNLLGTVDESLQEGSPTGTRGHLKR